MIQNSAQSTERSAERSPTNSPEPASNQIVDKLLMSFVTIPQAAGIAKVTDSTIRKWVRTGKIRAYGHPRHFTVLLSDVLPVVTNLSRVMPPGVVRSAEFLRTLNRHHPATLRKKALRFAPTTADKIGEGSETVSQPVLQPESLGS